MQTSNRFQAGTPIVPNHDPNSTVQSHSRVPSSRRSNAPEDPHLLALQLLAVMVLAVLGWSAGSRISRCKGHWWLLGFLGPMLAIAMVILGRRIIRFAFVWPISWIVRWDVNYLVMSFVVAMLFGTLIPRLLQRRQRIVVSVLMAVMVFYYGIIPVAMPAAVRASLERGPTKLDRLGVCLQTHPYTCGPAASVTALGLLGVQAQEGQIGAAAGTGPSVGTDPFSLARALQAMYGNQGIRAQYRMFKDLAELQPCLPVVAMVHGNILRDHYVTVVQITETGVILADPEFGMRRLTREDFTALWNNSGIVVGLKK